MDKLIDTIRKELSIPYISEEDTVMDGSFLVSPIITNGIKGDGKFQSVYDLVVVDLFFSDKRDALKASRKMLGALPDKYIIGNPDYTYEKNCKMWRMTVNISIEGGNEDGKE